MPAHSPPIRVRRMDLEFPDSMAEDFFAENPYLTALMAALSIAFPPGERFFIESVRHFLPEIDDPELRERVRGFIGQEANHTKEHIAFNAFLEKLGYPAEEMEAKVTKRIRRIQAASTPAENLARTAALEHFTAIMASAILEHPEVLERMSPEAAKLWAWHAIEEIEHRSVALDVYALAVDDEALRLRTMRLVTVFFITLVSLRTLKMMRKRGPLADLGAILSGLDLLWVRPGIFRHIIPRYLDYYRPGFHPSQHDYEACVTRAKVRYLGER